MTENRIVSFPVLETERLELIEINKNHLDDIYNIFNDDRVTKFYNIKTFTKVEDAQIYLDWFINRFKDGLGVRWGIQRRGETKLIGTIGFNNYINNHRSNIGYDLKAE